MAPRYKLTYFEFTGLAEPVRLLFHYGGIDFVDQRIPQRDWPAIKATMPLAKMPVLEVDGKALHQSTAIARYVAKQVGLAGDNDLEACEIDAAVETVNDLRLSIFQYLLEKNPERKKQIKDTLASDTVPFLLSKLNFWAEANKGYLANGKLSWADLYFVAVTGYLKDYYGQELLTEEYPHLRAVVNNVLAIPRIEAWIKRRPKDNFDASLL